MTPTKPKTNTIGAEYGNPPSLTKPSGAETPREYRIATADGPEDGHAIALVPAIVFVVEEYFAVRRCPAPAPWGEGYIDAFVLDHMPTGRKLHGGSINPASFEECEAFAKSLATLPVDWSSSDPDLAKKGSGSRDFITRAQTAAYEGKSITWEAEGAGHA